MMKIIAISDTHNMHDKVRVPNGDVLVHAGDFSSHGTASELWAFIHWLDKQSHPHKIFIAGNHDGYLENTHPLAVNAIIDKVLGPDSGVTYLFDSSITIDGKKFFGAPWQPDFCSWAFQAPRGNAMREKWKNIPSDTDVLITHGPAYGHGDAVGERSAGCLELLKKIVEIKPTIHICGHIHEGYGKTRSDEVKITRFHNVSTCDAAYRPVNKAHRIELQ